MRAIRLPYFTCRFTLEGLNLERFINLLGKEEIPLLSLQRAGIRKLICTCYQSDMPAIVALAGEKGWKLADSKPLQAAAFFAFMRRRLGIPLGFLLMLILCVAIYQFVWRIDIRGAQQYRGDIETFLMEERLAMGTPKSRVDAKALTQKLNRRYPDVAWFNVYVHDITLVVDCTLGVPVPPGEPASPGDLVASRDGVVVSILAYAGTPVIRPGDVVRKGQVLIAGTERAADESTVEVNAQGVVMARCWRSHTVNVPLREVMSAATGRVTEGQQVCTPWISFPSTVDTPPYLAYDTEITLTPLVGCFFPSWLRKTVFHEVSLEYVQRDMEKAKEEAGAAAIQKLLDGLMGNEIVDKWVDYCMIENSLMTATATAEWVMDIGSPSLP